MPHSFPTRRCADLAVGDLPRRERRALPAPPLSARSEVIEVELAAWPPSSGIGNPAVDVGFMPPCAVGADFALGRERAFGDLAIAGGPGQAGAGEDGPGAGDTVWLGHGWPAGKGGGWGR